MSIERVCGCRNYIRTGALHRRAKTPGLLTNQDKTRILRAQKDALNPRFICFYCSAHAKQNGYPNEMDTGTSQTRMKITKRISHTARRRIPIEFRTLTASQKRVRKDQEKGQRSRCQKML